MAWTRRIKLFWTLVALLPQIVGAVLYFTWDWRAYPISLAISIVWIACILVELEKRRSK